MDARGTKRVKQMMRAEDVGSERIGDVAEGLAHVRCAGAVINDGGTKLGDGAGYRSSIEEVDVLAPPSPDRAAGRFQVLHQITPDKPPGAGHESRAHGREPYCAW